LGVAAMSAEYEITPGSAVFELLQTLASRPHKAFTRDELTR
jgi:DNA-binding response OmpR family regulator